MIDHDALVWALFTRDTPAGTFISNELNLSATTPIATPAVIYSLANSGQTQNGPGLWTGDLDVQVIGKPDEAWTLASDLYDAMHAWADEQTGIIADVGHVQDLDDNTAFSRSSTTQTVGKGVVQYAGSFAVALRN
ncbi:hypothetical protein ACFJGV_15155 [Cnuibacter sp. UC19_7]|uniref:hypothetical protein n=1 Tax=Cnuibacter sp. UC19_7 TaxID=3350166 RepID=UPI00366C0503